MNKLIIAILFFSLTTTVSYCQDFSRLSQKEFNSSDDYKYAESEVLKCSEYLMNNPPDLNRLNRLYAVLYVSNWMRGTPDHRLVINKKIMNLGKSYSDLQSIHVASVVICALDSRFKDFSTIKRIEAANMQLINYCSNPHNNISLPSGFQSKLPDNISN